MTNKDHAWIAGVIAGLGSEISIGDQVEVTRAFATALQQANPRFNRVRFELMCRSQAALLAPDSGTHLDVGGMGSQGYRIGGAAQR